MTFGTAIALVGVAVTITFGMERLISSRRRLRRIQVGAASIRLSTPIRSERLKLLWDDIELRDAKISTFRITNVGSKDLTSDDFDNSKSIIVRIPKGKVIGALSIGPGWDVDAESAKLTFGPDLLKSGRCSDVSIVMTGDIEAEWQYYLKEFATKELNQLPPAQALMDDKRSQGCAFFVLPWAR